MIRTRPVKEKKRKSREVTKAWMNTPITFLQVSTEDVLEEPLIIEAEARLRDTQTDLTPENEREKEIDTKEVIMMEEVLVNMAFLDQLVIIGGGLSKACKSQLRLLLKDNMEIFAWEPIDMTGIVLRSLLTVQAAYNMPTSLEDTDDIK
ncbi:hypothetical protein Tco_1023890 [Tanacetum coccineum]